MSDNGNLQNAPVVPALLLEVASTLDQYASALAADLPPTERLEQLENAARDCFRVGAQFIGRAWELVATIKHEGLWREASKYDLSTGTHAPFVSYADYVSHFWETVLHPVGERTVFAHISKVELMRELGVPEATRIELLNAMPSVLGSALDVVEVAPDGTVIGVKEGYRERIEEQLGIDAQESLSLDDKDVLREFLEALAEAPTKQDASKVVRLVREEVMYRFHYMLEEGVMVLTCYSSRQLRAGKHVQIRFRLMETEANRAAAKDPDLQRALRKLGDGRIVRI